MSEDVREFAESKGLEDNLSILTAGEKDSDFTDFIFDGIEKARNIINTSDENSK